MRPETLKTMYEPAYPRGEATRSYGIGFSLSKFQGQRRVGHGGAVYGFATDVSALPDAKLGVAVVITKDCANTTATRIADAALGALLAVKAGKPIEPVESTSSIPAETAQRLAGHYGEARTPSPSKPSKDDSS
ncbi:MAG: hypothetical protein U0794_12725 [Isosphaeraceae bacterium]